MKQKGETRKTKPPSPPRMDPTIWSELPEEILELILSLLPLKTFFNLRSTCRRFNSLVFSPPFASKHFSSSPFPHFLLLSHPQLHRRFALHDSSLATWRSLPIPSSSSLLSASNGLLCFSHQNASSFLVCNVLSKSSRAVEFPFRPFPFDSLSLASSGGGEYSVLALSPHRAFLYDSATRSWTRPDPPDPVSADSSHDRGVVFDGRLCFATPEPFSVVWLDLERREWARSRAAVPSEVIFVRLVSVDRGEARLLMVGGVGRNGISRSLRVWELSGGETEWVEIERVPELMCQKFMSVCYHNYQHVYCFWHQGMVCVCCYTWPEILYFRVSTRTWHWLPKCPSLPDKWSCGFTWFSFVPHLYALV